MDAIARGEVLAGGAVVAKASTLVADDAPLTVASSRGRYVSRGGEKLAGALRRLGVEVEGLRCLDVGASTGGFTDCLLQRGARAVVAVDVGSGQLAWTLRQDGRVVVLEGRNARDLTAEDIGGQVDLVVGDLSFISLAVVAPALVACVVPEGHVLVLVKPQFEAGRAQVRRGGVVRDPDVHLEVLRDVTRSLARAGIGVQRVVPSVLRGPAGNVEFFAYGAPAAPHVASAPDEELVAAVSEAHAVERAPQAAVVAETEAT